MSDHSWKDADVRCPFYKGNTRKAIVCEGLLKGENIRRMFGREDKCAKTMKRFCCASYEECQVFQLVYNKYA